MGTATAMRVQKHRKAMREAGYRPVQMWLPDVNSKKFRAQCEADSLAVANDRQEREILEWIEKVAEMTEWK